MIEITINNGMRVWTPETFMVEHLPRCEPKAAIYAIGCELMDLEYNDDVSGIKNAVAPRFLFVEFFILPRQEWVQQFSSIVLSIEIGSQNETRVMGMSIGC